MDESCSHCGKMTIAELQTILRFLQTGGVPVPLGLPLGYWFLGVARAGFQGPTPVPIFPEVHDELTGSWTAPFTVRNRPSGSSCLTTLEGGATRGYTEIPPVEWSVVMQLCPNTADTWHGNPSLPSRARRYSLALTGSAYAACWEAAPALHSMALLQVRLSCTRVGRTQKFLKSFVPLLTSRWAMQCPPWWSRNAISGCVWPT